MGEDDDLGFFGVEGDFFEDGATVDEVGFSGGFAQAVDGDYLVLLGVVGADGYEIVALGVLELHMCDISLEPHPYPQPILILLRVTLIKSPPFLIPIIRQPRLINNLLRNPLADLRVFPYHNL